MNSRFWGAVLEVLDFILSIALPVLVLLLIMGVFLIVLPALKLAMLGW